MTSTQPVILSPELIYGVRLVTLLAKANKVLRAEFHQHFPTDPANLYQEIKKHDKKLKLLLKQKVIHNTQYYILLPATGKTNSSEFDISLLVVALIAICPIQAPVTGWTSLPLPSDQSKGANFVRLRIDRNKILHTYFEFEEKRFTSIWDRIVSALEELGCDKQELRDLKTASLDPSLQADFEKNIEDLKQALKLIANLEDSLKGVTYNLFPPIPTFVGREKEIMEIHQNLIIRDKKHIAMVIYGLGGVGKSELARQYCNTFAVSYYKNNVIWINGEDYNTITEDFCNVAERIPLNCKDEYGKPLSIKSIADKVYRFFADRPVLFVFDNVINKTDLMEFMETNLSTNVSILVNSQIADWGKRFIRLRTDVLSPEDASTLLSQNINTKYTLFSDDNIKLLCEKMQYLPLALQQCIAYINRWPMTFDEYFKKFQSYADQILETNQGDEMYNKTVKTTWNMALDKLRNEKKSKLAITLITFMSFLDGKNIKKEMFYEYCEAHLANESLQLLQKYSLIVISTSNDDLEQTILMHSLLQYVIREKSKRNYLKQFLDIIFQQLHNDRDIENESYGKYWYYQFAYMFHQGYIPTLKICEHLPQIQIIFNSKGKFTMLYQILIRLEKKIIENYGYSVQGTINIRHRIAQCLMNEGNYKKALAKYKEVEKLQTETIGCKHLSTLTTQNDIALCLQKNGNYDEALIKYKKLKTLQMESIGDKHLLALTTQNNFAQCLQLKGNYDEALNKLQKVETLEIETLGYKHTLTLITQQNIAICLQNIGHNEEALNKFKEVKKLQIESFGYRHPYTLRTRHNLAQCLHSMGQYDKALNKCREVETLEIETLGYKHPLTLTTQQNIASCLQNMGHYDEALNKFKEVEKLQIESFGHRHPDTLRTRHNLAQCLHSMGQYDKALNKCQEVEKLEIEILGYKHPLTLTTQQNIAICLQLMGHHDEALNKLQDVEMLRTENFGYKHPDTLTTQYNIAICLQQMGHYNKALNRFQEVKKSRTEILGYKHPVTLTIMNNIAHCLRNIGYYDEALIKCQEVEKLQIEAVGYKHPDTLTTQHNIALCLQNMGQYDKALIKFQEVEKLQLESFGSKHPDTLTTQNNIALCLQMMGQYDKALNKCQEVEKLQIEAVGYKHPDTLTTQHNIASCLQKKGYYDKALNKFQEVEKLQTEIFGYKHPDTLTTQNNIALCLHNMGQYEKALIKFLEVEKLQIEAIGYKHPSTLTTQHNIASCLKNMEYFDEALIKFQEVEKLQIKTIGSKHPHTLTTQLSIDQCFSEIWEII